MTLITVLRLAGATVAFALAALLIDAGEPGRPGWWIGALPFALWVIGPAVAPYLMANRTSRRWFSITMLLYLAVSSIGSGAAYYDAFFRSKSSTAALVLVFIPLYQWLALAPLILLGFGMHRGRAGRPPA